jgi:beta-mannosidase
MQSISLNGRWRVRPDSLTRDGLDGYTHVCSQSDGWIEAQVPGEIHLDLLRAGLMEEPLVSTNAQQCRWPEAQAWWYATTVTAPASFLSEERQQLIFDGLDLYAQVFLNGTLLGTAVNAFVPAVFDVKGVLHEGENSLMVRLTVGTELTADKPFPEGHTQSEGIYGHRDYHQRRWLRKPQFSYGWDWADALPNIGIWRGVRLEGHSQVVIHDLRLDTVIQGHQVFVSLDATLENLHPFSECACAIELALTAPDGERIVRRYSRDLQPGFSPLHDWIEIPEPQLWWPNGMGEQPLYQVTASVMQGKRLCDRRDFHMGLRVIEVDRAKLPAGGNRFCIRVNGHDVFCKGGNWVPADSILARVDRKKYEALVAAAKDANLNMLRVWGGGIYEDPAFYDACDRAGMLVWQDFMFACKLYPDHDPDFRAAVRQEAQAVVRALRHHPCIALWCGINENIWAFAEWWTDQPDNFAGSIIYNRILPEVCQLLDPERVYWPSSPAGGEMPNCETAGDCHWWTYGQRQAEFPLIHEVFDTCRARFVSEYGMIGPLHEASMKECLKPEERRRDSLAFQVHTNTSTAVPVERGIAQYYADSDGLSLHDFTLYGQMAQAHFYGGSVEAFRFRRYDPVDDCQGALIWMYDDCWGEMGWTPIDYYLRRKASYYWLKRACKPVKVIVRRRGRQLVTRIINDTRHAYRGEVRLGWMRLDGTETRVQDMPVFIPTNSMIEIATERIPAKSVLDPRHWVYAALLHDGARFEPDSAIYPLLPTRRLRLSPAEIQVTTDGREIELLSQVYCHAVHAEDGGRGLLSDNYFDLLPGLPTRITYLGTGNPANLRFSAIVPPGNLRRRRILSKG